MIRRAQEEKPAHSSEIIPVAYFPPLSHAVTTPRLSHYQNLHLHSALVLPFPYYIKSKQMITTFPSSLIHPREYETHL